MKVGILISGNIGQKDIKNHYFTTGYQIFIDQVIEGFIKIGKTDDICIVCDTFCYQFVHERYADIDIVSIEVPTWYQLLQLIFKRPFVKIDNQFGYRRTFICEEIKKFCDVLWIPFAGNICWECDVKTCYTIHDLISIKNSNDLNSIQKMLESTSVVVAISNYVRNDIIEKLQLNGWRGERCIEVISNPITHERSEEQCLQELVGRKYILDINAYRPHKNTMTLLKAYEQIRGSIDVDLVLCGSGTETEYYQQIQKYIYECGLSDVVFLLSNISNEEIEYLYNHAILFVNPSMNEGFGRTPIEAALHRIPVLTSQEASLFEVTKGKLEYIENPLDYNEIASRILHVLQYGVSYDVDKVAQEFERIYSAETVATQYWHKFQQLYNLNQLDNYCLPNA